MTDKDIIKALECCLDSSSSSCKNCPLFNITNSTTVCSKIATKFALDLINRQQAKLEALTEDTLCLKDTLEENERLRAEIERLREIRDLCNTTILEKNEQIEKLKTSDASKEECTMKQHGEIKELKAEIKRLSELEQGCYVTGVKNIRAEAIKEFAKRVQTEIATIIEKLTMTKSEYIKENYKCLSCDFIAITRGKIEILNHIKDFIDNLVKEMVGEDK